MRQHAKLMGALALFLCCALLLRVGFDVIQNNVMHQSVSEDVGEEPVIILDAGHGGEDGGAVGVNGVLEKELNLSLTRTLADFLRAAGYTVVQTRTDDALLYSPGTKKGHKKQSDLENRLAFTKDYPNSIFVSIHMNTFPNNSCQGTQVWYSQNDEKSAELAACVQSKVKALLQPQNNRKIKAATSSIYLLRHAQVPSLLIECGFLTTSSECERLCDATYRKMLALAIFEALCEKIPHSTCESTQNAV